MKSLIKVSKLVKKGSGLKNVKSFFSFAKSHVSVPTGPIAGGPLQFLQERIKAEELQADEHQTKVTANLQNVFEKTHGYTPNINTGFFSKAQEAPKGLYLYGSVGGGKTMLMDLFFDSCSHVSSFMICWYFVFHNFLFF